MTKKTETIIVQSAVYQTEYTNKYRRRVKWEKPNEELVLSFMPGTIIDVLVKPGEKVKKGDTLLILEAMKMLNNVLAPFNGKVSSIMVSVGDKIPKNAAMVEINRS